MSTMAVQNDKALQSLVLLVIMVLDSLYLTTAMSAGEKLPMEVDDIGKIVNTHNDFRATLNQSGDIQTIVSLTLICVPHVTGIIL